MHRLKSGSNGFNINVPQLNAIQVVELPLQEQEAAVRQSEVQRELSGRLGSILVAIADVADAAFLGTVLSGDSGEGLEGVRDAIDPSLDEVSEVLGAVDVSLDAELSDRRRHFSVRPSMSDRATPQVRGT